ncbi:MAG: 4-hydroxy-tetrahydrodipicolinate reductase [Cryomorphaceae bacterium]
MLKIGVAGAAGKMGRSIVAAVADSVEPIQLSAAFHYSGSSLVGADAGELAGVGRNEVLVAEDIGVQDFDILIDFSTVDASIKNLQHCVLHGKAIVIGTTGFNLTQKQEISDAARKIPVVLAANTSVGMNLCFHLVRQMSQVLGQDSDIEIIETHHRHKIDSPSGTAVRLGEAIAETLQRDLAEVAVYGREGIGEPRNRETIGFSTVRGGDVVGDHTILFASEGERVELTHKASSRMTFAKGAVRAALWLSEQPSGFYDMQDVLGLGD